MWVCPTYERTIRSASQWHNCVKIDMDSLFEGKHESVMHLFDKLLLTVTEWEDVSVSATQNCFVFVHRQTFLVVRPLKKHLNLKFYSQHEASGHFVTRSVPYAGKFEHHAVINSPEQLSPELFRSIHESYRLL